MDERVRARKPGERVFGLVDIQWMSNEGYHKRMIGLAMYPLLIFTAVGFIANWVYERQILGPMFLVFFI